MIVLELLTITELCNRFDNLRPTVPLVYTVLNDVSVARELHAFRDDLKTTPFLR